MKPTVQVFYVTALHNGERSDVAKFFERPHAEAHVEKSKRLGQAEVDERTEDIASQHKEHEGMARQKAYAVMFVPKPGVSDLPTVEVDIDDGEFKDISK